MKVVAFNGSPRVNGNTHQALDIVLEELRKGVRDRADRHLPGGPEALPGLRRVRQEQGREMRHGRGPFERIRAEDEGR
ncbi:MAG: NAD(P)H-dependent oxidoreductase [Methanomassiliicoccales archaeon]